LTPRTLGLSQGCPIQGLIEDAGVDIDSWPRDEGLLFTGGQQNQHWVSMGAS